MDKNYWINRWRTGQTGWHQKEPEPRLLEQSDSEGRTAEECVYRLVREAELGT